MGNIKVLICGATGFIGRNIVERFALIPEFEVHAVRFKKPEYALPNVTWHQADLRNPEDVDRVLEGKNVVIQAAATTSGSKDIVNQPYIHVTDNAVMNSYIFRSAFEQEIKHVIFFSCTVMYPSNNRPLVENDFDANSPMYPNYFGVGNTKVYLEKMCEFFANIGNTKFTAIRHSNIYGPHDKFDLEHSHVFGATITKVMTSKDKISVWGTGEEERDLLYVDDLVGFTLLAIRNQKEKYELLNCGYGKAVSIKDLVAKIIKASGKKLKIEHDLSQPSIKTSLSIDSSLAKRILGWEPKIHLNEGILRTLKWWKENFEHVHK
jgi:GDP-L-fucose synthase